MNRWKDALLFVSIAVATGCAMRSEAEVDAIQGEDTLKPAGVTIKPIGDPPPDKNRRAECLTAILTDTRLTCIYQGLGVGGAQSLEDQQCVASGCGCTAEIVETDLPGVEEGQQRVAISCPGNPPFYGIFSPPPGPPGEPPFIGIHINPDEENSSMCDVTFGNNGVIARETKDNCSSCHGQSLTPKWYPTADAPEVPTDASEIED